jgi:hypothetical protein
MGGSCSAEWADNHLAHQGDDVFLRSVGAGMTRWYVRFRDDALWCVPVDWVEADVEPFMQRFSHESGGLQLEAQFPAENSINWLDLTISWNTADGKPHTALYRKETYSGLYVAFDSGHARQVFPAWVKAEAGRISTNSTCRRDALRAGFNFAVKLQHRGYPDWRVQLDRVIRCAHAKRRSQLLTPPRTRTTPLPLVLPFCHPFTSSASRRAIRDFRRRLELLWPDHPRVVLAWANPNKHLYLRVRNYE